MSDDSGYSHGQPVVDLRQRVDQLSALHTLSRDAAEAVDLNDLLSRTLGVCRRLLDRRRNGLRLYVSSFLNHMVFQLLCRKARRQKKQKTEEQTNLFWPDSFYPLSSENHQPGDLHSLTVPA